MSSDLEEADWFETRLKEWGARYAKVEPTDDEARELAERVKEADDEPDSA